MFFVYIMTNKTKTVLYTGMTNNLKRRVYEHKSKLIDGFTKKYNVDILVYYEEFSYADEAILREKSIKYLVRIKKELLINQMNPEWKDLSDFFE